MRLKTLKHSLSNMAYAEKKDYSHIKTLTTNDNYSFSLIKIAEYMKI